MKKTENTWYSEGNVDTFYLKDLSTPRLKVWGFKMKKKIVGDSTAIIVNILPLNAIIMNLWGL